MGSPWTRDGHGGALLLRMYVVARGSPDEAPAPHLTPEQSPGGLWCFSISPIALAAQGAFPPQLQLIPLPELSPKRYFINQQHPGVSQELIPPDGGAGPWLGGSVQLPLYPPGAGQGLTVIHGHHGLALLMAVATLAQLKGEDIAVRTPPLVLVSQRCGLRAAQSPAGLSPCLLNPFS